MVNFYIYLRVYYTVIKNRLFTLTLAFKNVGFPMNHSPMENL